MLYLDDTPLKFEEQSSYDYYHIKCHQKQAFEPIPCEHHTSKDGVSER